ncbi:putative metacaspase putativecysteine peptidase Clan CD family C13 [Leptomonas pyrrhocoris]|uniref:Putative metacaspase putativecysteine peptidase Clan CD family C13 n=1 Tax=Leptomonas pyrrhocoris TaxID=157538 RepID=A0A0N0VDK3_LEPPY|nr:putative metacaspase putativecysteine peptidase Clan CD family C13 [Leptomonas pyrrhocoris]XP_015654248.1 putative metacaspase putativecysteine peptidase Clan CD family C13 [Leptomonas pyrrhocoris]XP_015654249.1 putative metacaspase putativecysteine peptidase Clan CD family C13 [Leptomonas pyrrhocoris]KPA75808.1 putative metacaspase putativecysteine peptidase Clan CD family C13 [Leptomonas pyrrhocoris]KPA75809.1 putative metacaspase putativecysteine peptidase Clan CD family C13 [Leptomonas p|eukprot:XP_015654247.1 putative metacaspase putativecysteine peptidase Clan CD family C13 [Leptomonas pyrrhocoris]
MGFDMNCIYQLCGAAKASRDPNGQVNWMKLGMNLIKVAGPYVVSYIGEVSRPDPVDINQAFEDADNTDSFHPYEAPAYEQGDVRALLVGINYYGSSAELSGCVNDVRQELATFQKIKFPVAEMAILVDESDFPNTTAQPTRANIVKYMAWLVKGAKSGDVLFMHYSGHGSQTKSTDQYEEYDQVICPSDYASAGCIVDNDIFKILGENLPQGVRLTILFDCCHSGSMMDLPYNFVGGSGVNSSRTYHMQQVRKNNFCPGDVLMISGCMDTQTSADVGNTAALGNGTTGAGGAATQCLTYILLNTKELSYTETMVKTREMLTKKKFEQVPQLSASKPINLDSKFSLTQPFNVDSNMKRTLPMNLQ